MGAVFYLFIPSLETSIFCNLRIVGYRTRFATK